ncbi:N-acetylmuramoyl-L-alanine amidase, partial [bacterium]|nr:N-acetylmuramoyl-L-alanine amidase [bacterium]
TIIYYYYPQAKPLADSIIRTMTEQLPFNDDKVRRGSLAVVRNTNALSVLIEVAYLINPEDNFKLINNDIQKDTAKSIADGIEEFLKN